LQPTITATKQSFMQNSGEWNFAHETAIRGDAAAMV
jgi:hypothetical protein